ncbi:MAG TPA: hypothetical protein VFQ80_13300, partial [Thermomicrobiales bacterium]|nr:hypothetical protein [Thermomicrobiales bacterium]
FDLAAEFHDRAARMVCCNMATVDERDRPRSRIVHPIWEDSLGWIGTWRTAVNSANFARSLKVRQLAHNLYVSLAYIRRERRRARQKRRSGVGTFVRRLAAGVRGV